MRNVHHRLLLLQTLGQKYTPPATVAIILTLESVFGTAISVMFYEKLSLRLIMGFLLIFLAVLISETKLSFIREKMSASKITACNNCRLFSFPVICIEKQ